MSSRAQLVIIIVFVVILLHNFNADKSAAY